MCFQSAKQKIAKSGQSSCCGICAAVAWLGGDKAAVSPERNGWESFVERNELAAPLSFNKRYREHNRKIKVFCKQYSDVDTTPNMVGIGRIWIVVGVSFLVVILWFSAVELEWVTGGGKGLISLWQLAITSPILFALWAFRDKNRLYDLRNSRKDTNLKEFQQLQQWATGNIPNPDAKDDSAGIALQISALHALRPYLKGTFGEDFRRGAFEIYASTLRTQHKRISARLKEKSLSLTFENIRMEITACELTTQLNRIASEEWFNLLINHDFPTARLSLMGVRLEGKYLQHRWFGQKLNLYAVNFQGANMEKAELQGADLRQAKLQGANLWAAQLQDVNMEGAELQGAYLEESRRADLEKAQRQDVNLRGDHLEAVGLLESRGQGKSQENIR